MRFIIREEQDPGNPEKRERKKGGKGTCHNRTERERENNAHRAEERRKSKQRKSE